MKNIPIFAARARRLLAVAALAGALAAPDAQAGRSCEQHKLSTQALVNGMALAERTQQALEASGAQVVVLARAGQDLSKYHMRYSHLGLAYKTPQGWRVLHKLNTCGTAQASLYLQGLGEFFMDDPHRYEAGFVPLQPQAARTVQHVLANPSFRARMHHGPYNMLSYPWSTRYQQSNQWALETIAFAVAGDVRSREQAQDWLQRRGYEPVALNMPPLTRLGGRLTRANVAFDDHPNAKRFSDRIETVSVESVFAFLQREGLGGPMVELR